MSFWNRTSKTYACMAAMSFSTYQPGDHAKTSRYVQGFQPREMKKGEYAVLAIMVSQRMRPERLMFSSDTSEFFVIDKLTINCEPLFLGRVPARAFVNAASSPLLEYPPIERGANIMLYVTCVGERTIVERLWYKAKRFTYSVKRNIRNAITLHPTSDSDS